MTQYILSTFAGVDAIVAGDGTFFIYDPERTLAPERKFPFATLVTGDAYDQASDLNRPAVFRLNIGLSKERYRALFGPPPTRADSDDVFGGAYDFTALDRILPHPVYAAQSWVCVLNPSAETFVVVAELLAEAYERAVRKYAQAHGNADR